MKMPIGLLLVATLVIGAITRAQCPQTAWAAMATVTLAGPYPNPRILTMIDWDPDGAGPLPAVLVVGGLFTSIGGVSASNIALFDGATWQPLGSGSTSPVGSLCLYNGDLVAGGSFPPSAGATGIARWDGSTWQALGPGLSGYVGAMTLFNGDLVAAGSFTSPGSPTQDCIARWNGTSWQSMVIGQNVATNIISLAVYNGSLVAGGLIWVLGGVPMANLAIWTGTQWLPGLPSLNNGVAKIAVWNGQLVIAGSFTSPFSGIARFDGVSWSGLGGGLSGPGPNFPSGQALVEFNGELILGGSFTGVGVTPAQNVARWTGTCWEPLGTGLTGPFASSTQYVRSLFVHQGALLAGGEFTAAGSVPLTAFARWAEPNPVLTLSQPGGPGTGVVVSNSNLATGHEYYNVASATICPGCIGSGPIGGLCFGADLSPLYVQVALPVGTYPYHFVAPAASVSTGPYVSAIGLALEAVCADFTNGTVGCVSRVVRFTAP